MDVEYWSLEFLCVVKILRQQKVVSHHQGLYLHLGPVGSLATSREARELNHWKSQIIKFDSHCDHTQEN